MTSVYEIREQALGIYKRFIRLFTAAARFIMCFLVVRGLNNSIGCYEGKTELLLTLGLSVFGALVPTGGSALLIGLLALFYLYKMSLAAAIVGFCLFLLAVLLYFRFSPKDSALVLLTPILSAIGFPFVLPLAAGLFYTPFSIASFAVALISKNYIDFVEMNASSFSGKEVEALISELQILITGVAKDKTFLVYLCSFAAGVVVVYVIRNIRFPYSWYAAVVAGALAEIIGLFVGKSKFGGDVSVGFSIAAILGGLIVAAFLVFLFFDFAYAKSEYLRFSDDDYYYYVHAVPRTFIKEEDDYYEDEADDRRRSRRESAYYEAEPADDYYEAESSDDAYYAEENDDDFLYMDEEEN